MNQVKIQKRKFIRNTMIGFISLAIVAFVLNIAPGYKRDKQTGNIKLIMNEENITEMTVDNIYVNSKGVVYLSEEDVRSLFDSTILYDEEYNQVITTADKKVASLVLDKKEMVVNDSKVKLVSGLINRNGIIYLPISEMKTVYNIEIEYKETQKIVVVQDLNKGMIIANVIKDIDLKYKPKGLSKNIAGLKKGEKVYCFYTTSKGWRQVRRETGEVRIY